MRALTRVATPENEAKLLEMALIATGAQLERLCRGYRGVLDGERTPAAEERSVRQRLLPGGMVKLDAGEAEAAEAAGAFAFHSPAGTLLAPDSPRELVDDTLDWLREWAVEHKLDLGPDVNLPQWDGKTPDYDGAVGWLLAAGQ